ncbi:MAG: ABC transporter permease subunit [Alphaproteobacteria bacterium]|nr:ABC transporter permease subunit [Alphaproteobacteria bacterium]
MRIFLVVVQREFLEAFRQKWLLVTLTVTLAIIAIGALSLIHAMQAFSASVDGNRELQFWSEVAGMPLSVETLISGAVVAMELLVFNQLMSMTAVMAGHAGIHDRQCGTLPFLMLAPVRRFQLLAGKVVGALSVPLVIYVLVGGTASALASMEPLAVQTAGVYLPPSGAWIATFFVTAPAWSLATGVVCVLVSAVARDVRTAQQAAWALVFFATFVGSPLLVLLMPYGAVLQLVLAAVVLGVALVGLGFGSWLIGRDLTR